MGCWIQESGISLMGVNCFTFMLYWWFRPDSSSFICLSVKMWLVSKAVGSSKILSASVPLASKSKKSPSSRALRETLVDSSMLICTLFVYMPHDIATFGGFATDCQGNDLDDLPSGLCAPIQSEYSPDSLEYSVLRKRLIIII